MYARGSATPSGEDALFHWTLEPSILLGLLLLTGGFVFVASPLRKRRGLGPPLKKSPWIMLAASVLVLVLALVSPLDGLSDSYLFSAHMVQHLLLAALWPPLFLLAMSDWMVRPLFRRTAFKQLALFLTNPVVAIMLFNFDVYLWHLPGLYDLTLKNEGIHILEHVSFMTFGLLNWWPILSPLKEQRLSYPLQVLYLFVDGMLMMVLGIVFTFSPKVFYSGYLHAPRPWDISVLSDQQLGGLIMWYPGNVPYGIALVGAFYKWFEGHGRGASEILAESPTIERPSG